MNDPLSQHDPELIMEVDSSIRADLDAGIPLEQITASLEKVGWTHEEADAAVAKAYAARLTKIADIQDKYAAKVQKIDQKYRTGSVIRIIAGSFLILMGLATAVLSSHAVNPGRRYLVAAGLIGVGILRLLTGLSDLRTK